MKTIKAKMPGIGSDYIWYVCPAPDGTKISKSELFKDKEQTEYLLETPSSSVKVTRYSWLEYAISELPEMLCKAAYGYTKDEMISYLKQNWQISPEQKIAFFLFKKLEETTKINKPKGIGLPLQ